MEIINIDDAGSYLPELVDRALRGEEITLARDGKPLVRLTRIPSDDAPRFGGQWRGRVKIAPDFDDLPSDLANGFGFEPQ